ILQPARGRAYFCLQYPNSISVAESAYSVGSGRVPLPLVPLIPPAGRLHAFLIAASILVAALAVVAWSVFPLVAPGDSAVSRPIHPEATNNFDQLVAVLMEHHDLAQIY